MKTQNFRLNIDLKDVDAVICALDLVANIDADSAFQNQLNYQNCLSVVHKLRSGVRFFTLNEVRVICVGISTALDLISGSVNPFISMEELDPEWQAQLRRNLFVYNKLFPDVTAIILNHS